MNEILALYSLIYVIVALCFVYRTDLFVSVGLTVENLFDSYLGREQDSFVIYHIKRACITTVLHQSIPFGFFTGLSILKVHSNFLSVYGVIFWELILLGSLSVPLCTLFRIIFHYRNGWSTHPIVKKLHLFENDTRASWTAVCYEINAEYKSLDKTILHCGNRTKVVLTTNWIVKVGIYDLEFANQSDARIIVLSSDTNNTTGNSVTGMIQFLNLEVQYERERKKMCLRLYSLDFKDLKEAVRCPVEISPNVTFYESRVDQFLHIFKDIVQSNPTYKYDLEPREMCVGCMTTLANVKLVKNCNDIQTEAIDDRPIPICVPCRCRPLWCVDCMGKWFASRQNQSDTETWLSSKCTCPVCRSPFCVLDISYIEQ